MNIWNRLDLKNREFLGIIHATLIILLVLSVTLLVYAFLRGIICSAGFEYYSSSVASSVLFSGVLAALLAVTASMVYSRSKDYMEGASSLLSKAYDALSELDENGLPRNDRVTWLTTARFILASQELAKNVDLKNHKRILHETEMFWRGKLFDLLRIDKGSFSSEYYAVSSERTMVWSEGIRAPISARSLAVIYRFVEWPKDASDPIQNVAVFSGPEIDRMEILGLEGLVSHFRTANELLEEKEDAPD